MSKRKRHTKKKLVGKGRLNDAIHWLKSRDLPAGLVEAYKKRYSVPETVAREELMIIGYFNEISIQEYETNRTKWEYLMNPLSGELVAAPEGTEECELFLDDQFF